MAKKKVHTSKHQNRKCHRNGIKKPKLETGFNPLKLKGMNRTYVDNLLKSIEVKKKGKKE